ncbi:hypothetical protein PHSY_005235 [Pseudozyma hubeiensis SY62]|uniref:Uncharacterized protein n=1 Tax=Pseudozyma hubeiensis (strain SY62) TaxID=1305764 RepID=R9P8H4_PSEHS|nr:hypothetical protein PHSY_005235 [Pseudozyma hubeiensis SY62]GAC97649.1 hypothetical protein PHSY_005235 [Pseudozyma hubeiensis SY62]
MAKSVRTVTRANTSAPSPSSKLVLLSRLVSAAGDKMATTDTGGSAPAMLEPHQLAASLAPPTHDQQISYVVEHCNYILTQLASDSLSPSLVSHSADSQHAPVFTTLPSSSSLEAYLDQLTSAQKQADARTAHLESQLRNQLLSSLSGVKLLKQKLSSLPDDIATTEDKLLDLCEDLVIASSSTSAVPESSRDGAATLMNRLDQLHTAIDQLHKAKAYFSILAQAEDLRLAVARCDQDQAQREQALHHLSELDALVRKVEKLSAAGSEQPEVGGDEPKLVSFLRSQRSVAFKTLRKARCARLSEAIQQTGWSQANADLSTTKDEAGDPNGLSAAKLLGSERVKLAWLDVCELQDAAEQLGLLSRATAKPSSKSHSQPTQHEAITAGSDKYQPLLTTQCLVEPMLLRFRYHFDGDRSTNRLDKPEWFLSHIASLIRAQAPLFHPPTHGVPGSGGVVVRLNRAYANASSSRKPYRHIDTYAELIHGLLTPLRRKLASTMPALLDHPSLLAHTVFQALTFDADLAESFPPSLTVLGGAGTRKISDDILDNTEWFNRWLDGEKEFALRRFEEIVNAADAWAIGSSDSVADDDEQVFYSAGSTNTEDEVEGQRTTKSARSTMEILESVSERYRPLPSLSQRLSFLAIVQLPILRSYAQRLTRSLDAFESLSSAFARAMPGEITSATSGSGTSDSDMVKGLRGLGRLVKALLSAQYVCEELERWSETSAFVELSSALDSTQEGRQLALGLRKDQGVEEDRELDAASLGMLLRRGLKRGAAVARPLAAGSSGSAVGSGEAGVGTPKLGDVGSRQVLNEWGRFGVWEEPRMKFGDIAARAVMAVERLITSEVLELLRPYVLRRWDQQEQEEDAEEETIPTPTLIPSLSMFSSHLGHLASILPKETLLPIYRHVSSSVANALVERIVMAGGSKRFTFAGGVRFERDLKEGWLGVVRELVEANAGKRDGALGRRPEAPWKPVLDAATLLRLPSSTSGAGKGADGVTLAKAVQIVFDATDEGGVKGEEYKVLLERLGNVDDTKINVREVLRRRVEVWK